MAGLVRSSSAVDECKTRSDTIHGYRRPSDTGGGQSTAKRSPTRAAAAEQTLGKHWSAGRLPSAASPGGAALARRPGPGPRSTVDLPGIAIPWPDWRGMDG